MGFYLESVDRPNKSRIAASDVHIGELVADDGSQGGVPFNASSHSAEDFLGVADNPRRGDYIAEEPDETTNFLYESAENDRIPVGGDADHDVIKVRTAEDAGGNESPPDISEEAVVGVVDTSAGTLSSTSEYEGRIVEEGYDDGESTATTYNRSNDNFFAVGVARRDSSSSYDDVVRVEVQRDL